MAWALLTFAAHCQNSLPETESSKLFAKGLELFQANKHLASRNTFEEFIRQFPNDERVGDASYYVAFNAISKEQEDAETRMSSFVGNYPNHPKSSTAYFDLGNFYFDKGQYSKSLAYFQRTDLESIDFENGLKGTFRSGYCSYELGDSESAIDAFQTVIEIPNPSYEDASYYLGFILYEEGLFEAAIPNFIEAEKSPKYRSSVSPLIAKSYLESNQFEKTISYTNKLGESKLNPVVQLLTAEAYYYTEDFLKAADLYELAINDKQRNDPVVYYHQGYANYRIGKQNEAIEAFKKAALASDTLGQYSSYYLGLLYTKTDQKQLALNAFEKASAITVNREIASEASFREGQLQYELGNFNDAVNQLETFLKTYPDSQYQTLGNELLSDALLKTSNYDLAISHIEGIRNKTDYLKAVYQKVTYLRGSQLFNDRQFARSLTYFDKSLSTPSEKEYTIAAHYWKGEAYSVGQKWPEAINSYSRVVFNRTFTDSPLYVKARYGLAYAYYNTKVYDRAKIQFAEFTRALDGSIDQPAYLDGLVRLGDCYFVEKNYGAAITNYEKALRGSSRDQAYLYLQLGLTHGFNESPDQARASFKKVLDNHTGTKEAARATYQWGQLEFETENFEEAQSLFTDLIGKYPESELVPYALVKLGVAQNNLGNSTQAIASYRAVLDQYPSHPTANGALLGLQEVTSGSEFDIDAYITKYREANPNDSSVESIEFESAKSRYFVQDYAGAINRFSKFIDSYPNSTYKGESLYFVADSYYRSENQESALTTFYEVLAYPQIDYYNRVLLRIGRLEFDKSNFEQAIVHYRLLGKAARNAKESFNAREGLMRSFARINETDSVEYYARGILNADQVSTNGKSSANLFLGKTAYEKEEYETALSYLQETAEAANDENAAEATFFIGSIYHDQGRYQESNEVLFEMNTRFSIYEYWLGKSFLLIADNYLALGEIFQAKATLNSIIEKSPDREITSQAQSALNDIQLKEAEIIETDSVSVDSTTTKIPGNR